MRLAIGRLVIDLARLLRFLPTAWVAPGSFVPAPRLRSARADCDAVDVAAPTFHPFCNLAQSASTCLRSFPLLLLLLPLIATSPDPARADDNADAANTAVQLFVTAGQAAGLPITQQEAAIVQQIVACGVANQSNVGDCAKNAAVTVVLQQAGVTDPTITNAVGCLVSTADPATCASKALVAVAKLPPDAQPAVNCMLSGGNVGDCGKKLVEGMVLDKIPADIQAPAQCIMDGGKAKDCATTFVTQKVISALPADMQGQASQVVNCLGSPNVAGCVTSAIAAGVAGPQVGALATCAIQSTNLGKCVADFASANLPAIPGAPPGTDAAAKAVVACVGAADFAACIKDPAITGATNLATQVITPAAQTAVQAAIDTIQKLQPDAPMTIDAGVDSKNIATLQNIVKVADGIKNKDWSEVVLAAGPELAIVAGNIILSVFLTPAVASALGPAVAAMIHNDANAAQLALQATINGDPVALAQVVFTWYETHFIDEPCALLGDNDVKNTVCGGLSDAIKYISDTGGDLAKKLLGAGEDVLKWLGVWGTVDSVATEAWNKLKDAVEDIGHVFGIGSGSGDDNWKPAANCANFTPKDYFANNYLTCLTRASSGAGSPSLAAGIGAMNSACVAAFDQCIAPKNRGNVASTCAAMGASLSGLANQVGAAMGTAADLYTNSLGPAAYVSNQFKQAQDDQFGASSRDFCDANFWDAATKQVYADVCGAFVNKQFPSSNAPQACLVLPNYGSGARTACLSSLNANLSGTAAAGKDLVGPGSAFCKAQQQWAALHPCEVKKTGRTFGDPAAGISIDDITINCQDNTPFKKPPIGGESSPVSVLPMPSDAPFKRPPGMGILDAPKGIPMPVIVNPPPGGFGGPGTVKGSDPRTPSPITPKGGGGSASSSGFNTSRSIPTTPKGGSSSGSNMINGNTNEQPLKKMPNGGLAARPSSSGSNTSRSPGMGSSGTNAAMDQLGGLITNNAIDSVSGNSGNTGPKGNVPRRAPSGGSAGSSGFNTSRSIPTTPKGGSAGSSGSNTSRSIPTTPSGGSAGSSGSNTSRSIPTTPSGGSASSSGFNTSKGGIPPKPAANMPVDFGGCPGCGQNNGDLHVR